MVPNPLLVTARGLAKCFSVAQARPRKVAMYKIKKPFIVNYFTIDPIAHLVGGWLGSSDEDYTPCI